MNAEKTIMLMYGSGLVMYAQYVSGQIVRLYVTLNGNDVDILDLLSLDDRDFVCLQLKP